MLSAVGVQPAADDLVERARQRARVTYGEAKRYAASADPEQINERGCHLVYCAWCPCMPLGCSYNIYCCCEEPVLWTICCDWPLGLSCLLFVSCFLYWGCCGCEHTPGNWQTRDDNGTESRLVLVDAERQSWVFYTGESCMCCEPVRETEPPCCYCEKCSHPG